MSFHRVAYSEGMALNIPVLDSDETQALLALIEPQQLLDNLRAAFAGFVSGASVQPPTAIAEYPDGEGDCVFLSGLLWDLDLLGVKVSPLSESRRARGLHPVTAYTMLLSARTGEPLMMCDSHGLTSARTGAATALGVDYLANPDAEHLVVIGAGNVAIEHIRHVAALRRWKRVEVHSPSLLDPKSSRRSDFEAARGDLEKRLGLEVTITSDKNHSIGEADVVLCCTSANSPVVDAEILKPGVLVTSVSSDISPAHEVAPGQLHLFDVYCDYRPTATKAWEMKEAVNIGTWSMDDIIADLTDLTSGSATVDAMASKYFRNHGVGIEDLVIANLIAKTIDR
jgi:L-arginine dehydrogenase